MLKLKSQRGHVPRQVPRRRGRLSIYERKCLPHGGCSFCSHVHQDASVCVCFMCLVNIYAPVNDEARKRQLLLPELPSCQLPRGCLKVAVEASDANCSLLSGRRLCACVGVCLRSGVVNWARNFMTPIRSFESGRSCCIVPVECAPP